MTKLIIMLAAVALAGCGDLAEYEQGIESGNIKELSWRYGGEIVNVAFQDHEYIVARGPRAICIIHSPACKCHANGGNHD